MTLARGRFRALRSLVAALFLLVPGACSSDGAASEDSATLDPGAGADPGPAADLADPGAPLDSEPSDVAADAPVDPADADLPPPIPEWVSVPLGADGTLHRVRFLPELGFRIVGEGTTLLRPLGEGWIRAWTPAGLGALHDLAVLQGRGLAVGEGGAWLQREVDGRWTGLLSGVEVDLRGVAGLASAAVAVGGNGVIVRYQGGAFVQESSGVQGVLRAVASAGEGSAYAVGDAGVAVRRVASPGECTGAPAGICAPCAEASECGSGACEVMPGETSRRCTVACGEGADPCPEGFRCSDPAGGGFCVPLPDHTWIAFQAAASDVVLQDILVLDSTTIWAVGTRGVISRFDGGQWQIEISNDTQRRDLYAVTAGSGEVLATGAAGLFLRHESNGNWSLLDDVAGPLFTTHRYEGLAAGPDRIIAAGQSGVLQIKRIPDEPFRDAYARPHGSVRALAFRGERGVLAGDDGMLVVFEEGSYGAIETGTAADLFGAAVAPDGTLWAVGASGTVLRRRPGKGPEPLDLGLADDLRGVLVEADGSVLIVGDRGLAGRIAAGTGSFISEPTPDPRDLLFAFEGEGGPTAIGRGGAIYQRQADSWASVSSGTTVDLFAADRGGGRTVVVGAHGLILSWPEGGGTPAKVAEAPGSFYYGVYVNEAGVAWIAGWAGAFFRLDPDGSLRPMPSPSEGTLRALARWKNQLFLGGDVGGLWRRPLEEEGSP